jgi:hypothetical protein
LERLFEGEPGDRASVRRDTILRMFWKFRPPSRQFLIPPLVLLVMLAWTSLAFQGDKTWYQEDTTISLMRGSSGRTVARMLALAGTIINYDGQGKPNFVAFAQGPKGVIEGKYGITANGAEDRVDWCISRRVMSRCHTSLSVEATLFHIGSSIWN